MIGPVDGGFEITSIGSRQPGARDGTRLLGVIRALGARACCASTRDQGRLQGMDPPAATIDWQAVAAIATVLLAFATVALAGVTVWLGFDQRRGRREAAAERVREALRAALAEQLENCRRWHPRDPSRGQPARQELRSATPNFGTTTALLGSVDLPPEVAAYVIWLIGDTRNRARAIRELLEVVEPADGSVPSRHPDNTSLRGDWTVVLERLQVLTCLLAAEASRRGFGADAAVVDQVAWEVPMVWAERERELARGTERVSFEAPSFPSDPAYARCGVGPRDALANRSVASVAGSPS